MLKIYYLKPLIKGSIRHTFATIIYKLMQNRKINQQNITDNDLIALKLVIRYKIMKKLIIY